MTTFTYEGDVELGCQEGGFAAPEIRLVDLEGGNPQGTTAKMQIMLTGGRAPKTLDEILTEQFGPATRLNDFGDDALGRLRITIERIP